MKLNLNSNDISVPDLIKAIICWILTAGWVVLIFYFSSETGSQSTNRSMSVLKTIQLIFSNTFITETIVRKVAHVIEFAIMTVLSFITIRYTNKISTARSYAESPVKLIKSDNEMYIAMSLWMSLLTAVVDEYHQLFVDGRDGSMRDVLIDSIGIIIVLIVIRIVFTIYLRYIGKKEIRYE